MEYNKKIIFLAAVCGFHFYRAWLPTESEKLKSAHDKNNLESQSFSLIEGQKWRYNYHQQTIGD